MKLPDPLASRLMPAVFVFLWSTGWITARAAAPFAQPLTFLSVRYALAAIAVALMALALAAPWPANRNAWIHALVAGVLLHAGYLGGVWWAIAHGVPAGVSGVIAGVQPILTALFAPLLLAETISRRQWLGIVLGFAGIVLVLWPSLAAIALSDLGAAAVPLAINLLAMVSVTAGTFYQKRFAAAGDLRTLTAIQYFGALAATLPVALLTEDLRFVVNAQTIAAMAWSVAALSIGGVALLLLLIRRGAVSRMASLIYLVPPAVALEAFLLFGETLSLLQVAGMAVTAIGVALVVKTA